MLVAVIYIEYLEQTAIATANQALGKDKLKTF